MDESKVVVIRSFATTGEAVIYKALLENSGIECELLNETMSSILPFQSEMTEVRLAVSEEDAAKAEEILSAKFDQDEFDKESVKRRKKP